MRLLNARTLFFTGALLAAVGLMLAETLAVAGHVVKPQTLARMVTPLVAPAVPTPESVFGKSRIHVLVLGRDYDYTANDVEYSAQSRSDAIMAFTIDFPAHTITELSVPRDTAVTMPDGSQQKINAALEQGGPDEARRVIGGFLGVPFDRTVTLRIDSTKSLIDAVGGVDVPVHEKLDYDDSWGHLHVHVVPGVHHMTGEQAVSYARFRHDECGDPCRIKRQQDVLHAIGTKLRDDKFNDFMHASALIAAIRSNVSTDLSTLELASLAWSFRDLDPKAITMAQVPYVGDVTLADGDALIPDDSAKARLVARLMLGAFAAPKPSAEPSPASASVAAGSIVVP